MVPTGTHFNYYQICHRKLWLFSNGINMENTSDAVYDGKLFEGEISEVKLKEMMQQVNRFIDKYEDSIILFKSTSQVYMDKEIVGKERCSTDVFL